jgi:tetratricopeptide (TPR) repeat protein
MRHAWPIVLLACQCSAYELAGRIEPPAAVSVHLHGATFPFESSAMSDPDGRFRFRKLAAGTYTLAVSFAARGEAVRTVELSPGTADAQGRLDVLIRIDDGLESNAVRAPGATVSAAALSVPDRARREYNQAQRCLSRSDSDCATSHLRRAIEIAPRFVAAWNQLGTMDYQGHRYADAETNFRRALDADPEAFEPLVNLGGALLSLNRPQEALGYNQRAVARRPSDALANSQLGLDWFFLNDLPEAEKYLKSAIRLDPAHFSHPQLALGEIYVRRGDRPNAIAVLRQFLDLHPDAPEAPGVRKAIAEIGR